MAREQADFLWLNGAIVPWADGTIHVASEVVKNGANVFEGIRGYWNDEQRELYLFRVNDHLQRLRQSAKILRLQWLYSFAELEQAILDLIRRNKYNETIHVRPVIYFGEGDRYSWRPEQIETGAFIVAIPGPHKPSVQTGVRSCISTWRRNSDVASPSRVKAGPNYHNSRLATMEADLNGFGIPIMLNDRGRISESPGSCYMMVRDGVLITPPVTADILESVTRLTVMQLAREELGLEVVEREVDRTEAYIAEESFFCGSGHEIVPIISVDHYEVGDGQVGPITRQVQKLYFDVVSGRVPRYKHWLTPVYNRVPVGV